jgi:hypothetical protein
VAAFVRHHQYEGIIVLTVTTACPGSLLFNFPPAKLFGRRRQRDARVRARCSGNPLRHAGQAAGSDGVLSDSLQQLPVRHELHDTAPGHEGREGSGLPTGPTPERQLPNGWSHLQVTLFYVGLIPVSLVPAFGYLNASRQGRAAIAACQFLAASDS